MYTKENIAIKNYFLDKEKGILKRGVVVECGACSGIYDPSITLEKFHGWKFFGFEPDPRYFSQLCQNRPRGQNIPAALSDKVGEINFTISAWGGNSSLEHSSEHKKELMTYSAKFDDGTYFKNIKVPTMNWSTFIQTYKVPYVNLLILDVEGQELTILKGLSEDSILPDVIQIEFGYSDYENSLLDIDKKQNFSGFVKIAKRLHELDYEFDYVNFNNAFFSQRKFWINKAKPVSWEGEDDTFYWRDICYYEKNICKQLIQNIYNKQSK